MIHLLLATALEAQQHLSAGIQDLFGYATDAALAEFQAAEVADRNDPLGYWGEALALGSDLNTPLTEENFAAAHRTIATAVPLLAQADPRTKALVSAVAARYAGTWDDRKTDERNYRLAMEAYLKTAPDDDDAAMFLVEDLLEQHGMQWNDDGTPFGDTSSEILSLIKHALVHNPQHLFANHLCIHAYDNAPSRTAAIPCAQLLDSLTLAPPLEHLAHMPAHIWIELGDGISALKSSERAWNLVPTRYAEHDAYVALSAAMMCGDRAAIARWSDRLSQVQGRKVSLSLPPDALEAQRLERGGKVDAAVRVLEKDAAQFASAREMLPFYPSDVRIGAVEFRAGRYQLARETFEAILEHRPRDPRALFGAAQASDKLGDSAAVAKYQDDFTRYWAGGTLTMNDF